MTPTEFQNNYSGELKKFYDSPCGKEFITVLHSLRPALPESFPTEHSMLRGYAKVEGYELLLRNMIGLCLPAKKSVTVEPTYGVPDLKK